MEIVCSMIAFFALVAAWFVLPSGPPAVTAVRPAQAEALAPAA